MKPTIKQLQATIKEKDKALDYYLERREILMRTVYAQADTLDTQARVITELSARIKVLNKALVALQKDYEQLKRKRK